MHQCCRAVSRIRFWRQLQHPKQVKRNLKISQHPAGTLLCIKPEHGWSWTSVTRKPKHHYLLLYTIHGCMCKHTHTDMHAYIQTHIHTHTYTHTHHYIALHYIALHYTTLHTHTHIQAYRQTYTQLQTYVHPPSTHAYIHACKRTSVHPPIQPSNHSWSVHDPSMIRPYNETPKQCGERWKDLKSSVAASWWDKSDPSSESMVFIQGGLCKKRCQVRLCKFPLWRSL